MLSINFPLTFKNLTHISAVTAVFILCNVIQRVQGKTQHIIMSAQNCNKFFRDVHAARLEGQGGYRIGPGVCEVTLSTPDRAKWMLKIDMVNIFDCNVNIQIYDTQKTNQGGKYVLIITCASTLPGIIYINTSTLTVRLKHNNSTNYSFNILATARKSSSILDEYCSGFRCGSGDCVDKSLHCDGTDNCFDYSDESSNGTAYCHADSRPFPGENWAVLASVLGAAVVFGLTAACCRHIRKQGRRGVDDLYELNEGPYVHKYAYRYAMIRPPKKANRTNFVLGRDGHMHYTGSKV